MKKILALAIACLSLNAIADNSLAREKFNPVNLTGQLSEPLTEKREFVAIKVQLMGPLSNTVLLFEESDALEKMDGEEVIGLSETFSTLTFELVVVLRDKVHKDLFHFFARTYEGAVVDEYIQLAPGDSHKIRETSIEKMTTHVMVTRLK